MMRWCCEEVFSSSCFFSPCSVDRIDISHELFKQYPVHGDAVFCHAKRCSCMFTVCIFFVFIGFAHVCAFYGVFLHSGFRVAEWSRYHFGLEIPMVHSCLRNLEKSTNWEKLFPDWEKPHFSFVPKVFFKKKKRLGGVK